MTFSELLLSAIQQSEIPLRYEPGAEEAVAEPVTRILVAWVEAHMPGHANDEYARGQKAVLQQLLDELNGTRNLPV
jgi:hypothetical protein